MQAMSDVLLPPSNAPSPPAPLPDLHDERGERGEEEFSDELPAEIQGFEMPQFDEFRAGPDVQWLWPGRIPRGMVTLIEGAEGAGKSFVALDIAARVSRGLGWPGLPAAAGGPLKKGTVPLGDIDSLREDQPFERDSPLFQGPVSAGERRESKGEVLILCRPDDCRSAGRRLAALGADFQHIRRLAEIATIEPCAGRPLKKETVPPGDIDLSGEDHSLERGSSHFQRPLKKGTVPLGNVDLSRQDPSLERDSSHFQRPANHRTRRPLSFPGDLTAVEGELRRGELGLVIIDSLADFCPLPQQVADTLRRLNELAEAYDVAIVVTLPANCRCDGQGRLKVTSRYRTGGARCVWTVLADADVPARRVFAARRTNFCEEPVGLAFRLGDGHIEWNPAARIDPADPLGLQVEISLCLAETLRDGSRCAAEVLREGHQCGFTPKQLRSTAKRLGIKTRKASGYGADGGWTWWTAERWAQRVARLQALVARSVAAEAVPLTDHDVTSVCENQREEPVDRSESRLYPGPASIHTNGTPSQAVAECGIDLLAQYQASEAARAQAATPAVASSAAPVAPAETAPRGTSAAPAEQSQPESSKNEESLKKQPGNARPAEGPLPRDGYSRRQERKRRQRERDAARKRAAES